MRRLHGKLSYLLIGMALVISFNIRTTFVRAADTGIVIDGYYDDWADKPQAYYAYSGKGKNPLDTSHLISFYRDRDYIYLFITFAGTYSSRFEGDNYIINSQGSDVYFYITFVGGGATTGNTGTLEVGNYVAEVRHAYSSLVNSVVPGAEVMITKQKNDINNQVELKIPIVALAEQNPTININDLKNLRFENWRLTNKKIAVSGTSTVPYVGIILCVSVAVIIPVVRKKRKQVVS